MQKIGLAAFILMLMGCATQHTPPGLIPAMPEELKNSHKDIDSAWREWKAPYVKTLESRSSAGGEYIPISTGKITSANYSLVMEEIDRTEKFVIAELASYCKSQGGDTTVATCKHAQFGVTCIDDSNNVVPSPSWLRDYSYDISNPYGYFICNKDKEKLLEVGLGRGTFHSVGRYGDIKALFIRTDSPQQRLMAKALSERDMSDYRLLRNPAGLEHRVLYDLISRFENKEDPENLLSAAKERLYQLTNEKIALNKVAEAEKEAAMVQSARLKREEFLRTVNVGSLVCRSVSANVDMPTGLIIRGTPQTKRANGRAVITGYVNQRQNQKLQIQVSGIQFRWLDDNLNSHQQDLDTLSHFQGNSVLRVNGIVWDNETDWEFCV